MSRDLYSLRMAEGVNCHKDARSAGIAKNENLIFLCLDNLKGMKSLA